MKDNSNLILKSRKSQFPSTLQNDNIIQDIIYNLSKFLSLFEKHPESKLTLLEIHSRVEQQANTQN